MSDLIYNEAHFVTGIIPAVSAARAPTANDDSADTSGIGIHFQLGMEWLYRGSPNAIYLCADATPTAATWLNLSGGSGFPLTADGSLATFKLTNFRGQYPVVTTIVAAGALTVNADNPVDTSGGAFAVTYPDPSTWAQQFILLRDAGAAWGVSGDALTITHYGSTKLAGVVADYVCNINGGWGCLYSDGTNVQVGGNLQTPPLRTVTDADANVVLADCGPAGKGGTIHMSSASTHNVILPANGTIPVPIGYEVYAIQLGSGKITWTVTSDTIQGSSSKVASAGQYAVTGARKITSTVWYIFGDRS